MCRAGGRRCAGHDSKAKARIRQRISRAGKAIKAARAAGDDTAAADAQARLTAAREELGALSSEQPAQDRDVTMQQHDDGHLTVVNTNYGGNVGLQAGIVGGVHIGSEGTTFTPGESGDVTGRRTVVNTNYGGNVGVQAGVINGGVVIGHAYGPVQTGDGVQINGGSCGGVSYDQSDEYRAAMDAARAARHVAKQARQKAKQERQQARQSRPAGGTGDVTIGHHRGGVMMADGYTVVGGEVHRHPGRSVSVNGTEVTDAMTGERLEPTRTVPDTGRGHSVLTSNGVLYVNGEPID